MEMNLVKKVDGRMAFDLGSTLMEASCHHWTGRSLNACGGCYARATEVLDALAKQGVPLAQEFISALKREAK